jgi:hypothetical protein
MARLLGQQLQQRIFDITAPVSAPPAAILVERIAAERATAPKRAIEGRTPARAKSVSLIFFPPERRAPPPKMIPRPVVVPAVPAMCPFPLGFMARAWFARITGPPAMRMPVKTLVKHCIPPIAH